MANNTTAHYDPLYLPNYLRATKLIRTTDEACLRVQNHVSKEMSAGHTWGFGWLLMNREVNICGIDEHRQQGYQRGLVRAGLAVDIV